MSAIEHVPAPAISSQGASNQLAIAERIGRGQKGNMLPWKSHHKYDT
jgi:hypothetical protein